MASSRMTAEIGRVLGGRYRVIAPIGVGASAQVYLADDIRLGRRVALKMLHDALAGDQEFLRRFRAEARAAAALSHPNVLAVYDWGDGEVAFIVTEYLAGGSLRSLLDDGNLLTTSQALTIGLEATRGLDYAHRRGFVHRDIKPANLLFGEDDRLRIADFGLARALAEAAWTEPQGAMLGTARYAAPEQAKGEHLDGKADVYSLALLLVEAVTGEVPFAADTMLGTLMARVDKPLVVPDALGPLKEILEQAGRPDPADRIDARAMAAGLLRAAKALPRPTPLPLVGAMSAEALADLDEPQERAATPPIAAEVPAAPEAPADLRADDLDLAPPDWVNLAEPGSTAVGSESFVAGALGAAAEAPIDLSGVTGVTPASGTPAIEAEPEPERIEVVEASAPEPEPTPRPEDRRPVIAASVRGDEPPSHGDADDDLDDGQEEDGTRRRRRRWPWVAAVLLLVLLGAGGYVGVTQLGKDDAPDVPALVLPVPSLTGLSQADAEAVAEASGWKTTVTTERRDDTVKGQVLTSTPASGARLARGGTVALVVSAGQTEVDVPQDLAGKSLADAKAALEAAGLSGEQTEDRFDEEVPDGAVLALADGTPARLERGTSVGLIVSKGAEPRTVPDGIVGSTEAEATQKLADVGLKVAVDRRFNDDVAEGDVVSQRPRPGEQLPRGGVVTIEVSRGPKLVAVPDVSGAATSQEAAALIRAAGLVPGSVSGSSEGTPSSTEPGTGTQVEKGSTVDIVLG